MHPPPTGRRVPARPRLATRGLVRSARALAAAALLALIGALALPATAQADVLVSNLGQDLSNAAHRSTLSDRWLGAQAFPVPSGGSDYTLTSIEIPFHDNGIPTADIDSLSVSVWSASSSGHPSSSLYTLTNPASIMADTTATFNALANSTLDAGDTYVVVVHQRQRARLFGCKLLLAGHFVGRRRRDLHDRLDDRQQGLVP